jgi:hypothetical protein
MQIYLVNSFCLIILPFNFDFPDIFPVSSFYFMYFPFISFPPPPPNVSMTSAEISTNTPLQDPHPAEVSLRPA